MASPSPSLFLRTFYKKGTKNPYGFAFISSPLTTLVLHTTVDDDGNGDSHELTATHA